MEHHSQNHTPKTTSNLSIFLFVASGILFGCTVLIAIVFVGSRSQSPEIPKTNTGTVQQPEQPIADPVPIEPPKTSCEDVTSIDYDWDNDVRCTRPDGSVFYTDYSGGYSNDPSFERD